MDNAAVEQALQQRAEDVAPALLRLREGQWFDRKSLLSKPAALAQDLVAFANAEGGIVVLGFTDGRVDGTCVYPGRTNDLRQAHLDHTAPPVHVTAEEVACMAEDGRDDRLLVLRVERSERVHTTTADHCYLRVGDETRRLTFLQRQELHYDKGNAQFDGSPVAGATVGELDVDLLRAHAAQLGLPAGARLYNARSLLTRDGAVTAGAYLFFGEDPQREFPEAYLRVLRYAGVEPRSGARQHIIQDIACHGPMPRQIESAFGAVEELIPTRSALGRSGRFERVPLIPRDAWVEAIVNAAIHRSYSLAGDHVRIAIYDNRVEVESPGRFPGIASLEKPLDVPRFARNPRIAKLAADQRLGQELGEGIRRMFEEMHLAGLGEPVYRQTQASVRLTLAAALIDPDVAQALPSRSREVMEHLRDAGGLSTGDVAERLGLSKPAVAVRLRALQDAGYVEWVGRSRKDPRAYWRLSGE